MAPPHNHLRLSPPSLSPPLSTCRRHRCSKAQMCFFQILHIISAFPSPDVAETDCETHDDEIRENERAFRVVDLNIRLRGPGTESEALDGDGVGENCVFEKDDRCGTGNELELAVAEKSELAVEEESQRATQTQVTEHSEISHVGDQSSCIDYNGVDELVTEEEEIQPRNKPRNKPRDEGYLNLLIEAAQLILGDESEQHVEVIKPPSEKTVPPPATAARGGAKRKQQCWTAAAEAEWYAEFEDTSPVVKSKRGRNQVLPFKYRDSVVEPLVRWSPSSTSSRKSIANATVPSRRRAK